MRTLRIELFHFRSFYLEKSKKGTLQDSSYICCITTALVISVLNALTYNWMGAYNWQYQLKAIKTHNS